MIKHNGPDIILCFPTSLRVGGAVAAAVAVAAMVRPGEIWKGSDKWVAMTLHGHADIQNSETT